MRKNHHPNLKDKRLKAVELKPCKSSLRPIMIISYSSVGFRHRRIPTTGMMIDSSSLNSTISSYNTTSNVPYRSVSRDINKSPLLLGLAYL